MALYDDLNKKLEELQKQQIEVEVYQKINEANKNWGIF